MSERNIFDELMQGMGELVEHEPGKNTLKTREAITLAPEDIKRVREKLNISQALFAEYLHISEATYRNWELGRARPNVQAVLLIRMMEQNPEMLHVLASL